MLKMTHPAGLCLYYYIINSRYTPICSFSPFFFGILLAPLCWLGEDDAGDNDDDNDNNDDDDERDDDDDLESSRPGQHHWLS